MLITQTTPSLVPKSPNIGVYRYTGFGNDPELVASSIKGILNKDDTVAIQTYEAAVDVVSYYKSAFGRNSFDNKGADVRIVVGYEEAPGRPLNNALWSSSDRTMYFGDGDGKLFSPLGTARDVVAHEFAHAVISSEVKLGYQGESGGIHESVSDIWATGVDGNFKIGEDIFTPGVPNDAIRDLNNMTWKHKRDLPQPPEPYSGEPHVMGEPLSHAAVLAAKTLGIDKIRDIWYTAVTEDLKDDSGYDGFRQATESAAELKYGIEALQSVRDAWIAVGIGK